MAHTHTPAPSTSVNPAAHQRRLIATLTVTGSVFLIEVVSAVLTGSLALLVDAGHMLTDMSVLAASTITAILMRRKPSNTRTWGLGPGLRCSPLPQVPWCCSSLASMR